MTTTGSDTIRNTTVMLLPLHNLVVKLRQHGFVIRPDDYIEMLKVVETFGGLVERIDASLLCPLIATSPEEQERFYKVFAEYEKEQIERTAKETERETWWGKTKRWLHRHWRWLLPLLLIAMLAGAYLLFSKKPVLKLQGEFAVQKLSEGDEALRVGDTVQFDSRSMFPPSFDDTTLEVFWNSGNGFKKGRLLSAPVVLGRSDKQEVQVKFESDKYRIQDNVHSQSIRVCPAAPQVSFTGLKEDYSLNDDVLITPVVKGRFSRVSWQVNDSAIQPQPDGSLRYKLAVAGTYSFVFVGLLTPNDADGSPCDYRKTIAEVTVTNARFSLNTVAAGQPLAARSATRLNPLLNWLLLPALLIAAGTWWWWRKQRKARGKKGDEPLVPTYTGRKPPYETPFENKDMKLTEPESGFRQVFQSFRQKAEDELTAFNVPASIRQTIRTGGMPELVFTPKLRYTDYVVLIDRTLAKSLQVKLFDLLVKKLDEEAICVERFYYTGKFEKISNEQFPDGLSFKRFSELYKMHTLIIMGHAHHLVYEAYPVLDKQLADILQEWEYKAILTPVAFKDWEEKEALIREKFILLPADMEGQLILLQAIREKSLNHQKYLSSFGSFYETAPFDFHSTEDLKAYLGDNLLFQWLCAVAVYHKLRWEVVIEVGKTICTHHGQPEKMNFSSLLKLCRIGWIADGAFPGTIRLELLKSLTPENEVLARETLLKMLHFAETYFGDDHFFNEEKEVQKVTSQFLLYAHNRKQYAAYAGAEPAFKALLDSGKLWDTPQKAYLENPGNRWSTLVQQRGRSTGIREYFNQQQTDALKAERRVLWRNGIAAALCVLLLGVLHLLKVNLPADSFLLLSMPHSSNFTVQVSRDTACGESQPLQDLQGVLQIGTDNTHNLLFNQQGLATVQLSPSEIGREGYLVVGSKSNEAARAFSFVRLRTDSVRASFSSCQAARTQNLNIVYNDSSRAGDILELATFLQQQGYKVEKTTVAAFDVVSKTVVGIRFFSANDRSSADTLAKLLSYQRRDIFQQVQIISDTSNQSRRGEYPEVAINFATTKGEAIAALNSRLTEIWRGVTNNRLITIYPPLIYYSTGDKRTFGTYRISEVRRSADGTFRIITRADQQYAVFFIRNSSSTGFTLSVCPSRFATQEEAAAVLPELCGPFDQMSLYYETDKKKAFLPLVAGSPLNASNAGKLMTNLPGPTRSSYYVRQLYTNSRFRQKPPARLLPPVEETITLTGATPFDRSYLQDKYVSMTGKKDPCAETYRSVEEVSKLSGPSAVCRLDLSGKGLTSIPGVVYNLPGLKWLNLKKNRIPVEEMQKFIASRPGVEVLYDDERPAGETPERRLTNITFDEKYSLDSRSQRTLSQIISYLRSNAKALVRVEIQSFYTRSDNIRTKQETASLMAFLQRNKYNARQWKVEVGEPQNVQQQAQQNTYGNNSAGQNRAIVYGTNFPANFLQQPLMKTD